jgi:hypothetical protein
VRPVYAPAFVAFVGGAGFSFGVGIGPSVAWFPLAPREVFIPWYHTSPVYVNQINITNTRVSVTQVTNVYHTTIANNTTVNRITYVNQRVPSAVTAVSHDTFANARPVQGNLVHVDEKTIANAPVTRSIAVQPVRQSVLGSGRPATVRPPAAVENRQVVATRTPTLPREPFAQHPNAVNVRAETPGKPQQPVRTPTMPTQPVNPRLVEQGTPPPAAPPETAQQQAARPQPAAVPHPPAAAQSAHPLVKTAPPVEERPEQQRSEQQKFNTWQQQRPSAPPRPAPRPAQPASRGEEKPHK